MTIDRRRFLSHAGTGALLGALAQVGHADVKLPPLEAPSEKPKSPPPLPDEPGKRLGVAVIGIGHLTMEQLLPAFAQSRSTKLLALVSGDRAKAEAVAARNGVETKRIYDYKSFDRIKDDPAAFDYEGLQVELSHVRGRDEFREKPTIPDKQHFALELDHLASCIRNDKQPYTPGEEGAQDMRIMEAILQSAREGKRIELPRVAKLDAFRGTPPAGD